MCQLFPHGFVFMNRKDTPVELCGKDGVYRMLTLNGLSAAPLRMKKLNDNLVMRILWMLNKDKYAPI